MTESLLAAIQKTLKTDPSEGFTLNELMAQLGIARTRYNENRLRESLKIEVLAQRAIAVRGWRTNILGERNSVPIYRAVTASSKETPRGQNRSRRGR